MNWAWKQELSPTPKLILMALADTADDRGVCWPSVPTLAQKCTVSPRTVQRVIKTLAANGLMVAEPRFRPDGSCSSNRYRLRIEGGDKVSPAPDRGDTPPRHPCQGPPDTDVTPRTTIRTSRETPPLPKLAAKSVPSEAVDGGGGNQTKLVFPKQLSKRETIEAQEKVAGFPVDVAQQILDELAARMKAGTIRVAPLAYLRGLAKRAQAGKFTPEAALRVAEARERHRQMEAVLHRIEAAGKTSLPPVAVDENSPLIRRLTAIRSKA